MADTILARNAVPHETSTAPNTQLGFVRISSNSKIIPDAVPPGEAVAMLERLVGLPEHVFWPDEIAAVERGPFAALAFIGHRQASDAYLLALAQQREGKLATLDGSIAELIAEREQRSRWVELIESWGTTQAVFDGFQTSTAAIDLAGFHRESKSGLGQGNMLPPPHLRPPRYSNRK